MRCKGGGGWLRSKNKRRGRKAVAKQVRLKEIAERQAADATGRKAKFGTWTQAQEYFRGLGTRQAEPGQLAT